MLKKSALPSAGVRSSRAYYGAFHAALALLARTGVLLPPAPKAHQKVRFCPVYSRESFRESRLVKNSSRYDVIEILLIMICVSTVVKLPNSRRQVRVALEILNCLEMCNVEPAWSKFQTNVRAYATKVLRIVLADENT